MAADNPHGIQHHHHEKSSPVQAGPAAVVRPPISFDDDDDDDRYFRSRFERSELRDSYDASDKISREIYVVGGGTVDAAAKAFDKEHAPGTTLEVSGSLAVGLAVKAAEARLPALRPALAVAGLAMTFAVGRDLLGHAGEISHVLSDTWHYDDKKADKLSSSTDDFDANKKAERQFKNQSRSQFAATGGRFAVDLAIAGGAGLAGSSLGDQLLFRGGGAGSFSRIPTYDNLGLLGKKASPHSRLYNEHDARTVMLRRAEEAVMRFSAKSTAPGRVGNIVNGNAFVISEDGLMVTNNHVVHQRSDMTVTDKNGRAYDVSVLKTSVRDDLALIKATPRPADNDAVSFKPLKLASEDPNPGQKITAVARQSDFPAITVSPGRAVDFKQVLLRDSAATPTPGQVVKGIDISVNPITRQVNYKPPISDLSKWEPSKRLLADYFSKPGISGAPVVSESGEVVGVHSGNLGRHWSKLTGRTSASPVSNLHRLIDTL